MVAPTHNSAMMNLVELVVQGRGVHGASATPRVEAACTRDHSQSFSRPNTVDVLATSETATWNTSPVQRHRALFQILSIAKVCGHLGIM